jgi:hypothetical protein
MAHHTTPVNVCEGVTGLLDSLQKHVPERRSQYPFLMLVRNSSHWIWYRHCRHFRRRTGQLNRSIYVILNTSVSCRSVIVRLVMDAFGILS